MLWAASILLKSVYLLLPLASLAIAWNGDGRWRRFIISGWLGGIILAAMLLVVYAVGIGGRVSAGQIALAAYCGVGLLLFLKSVDAGLTFFLQRYVLRNLRGGRRALSLAVGRLVIFGSVALPWVMAAAMVYRPHVRVQAPMTSSAAAEHCQFPAADGTSIAGWYFPAETQTNTTALLCHGLGGNTGGFSKLIDRLHESGINVLAIEMRAHGDSGGQFCSFGLREKNDAIGAVQWLKTQHADAAERIVGVGASLGAAALLGAAADDNRFDGIVVLSTYSSLTDEVQSITKQQFVPPLGWLIREFGLPIASLHVGVDLRTVRPIDDIAQLWPRPVLIVHGTADEIIPFEQGRRLYNAAPLGRQSMWVQNGTHNGILDDNKVIDRVVEFIQSAQLVPVI